MLKTKYYLCPDFQIDKAKNLCSKISIVTRSYPYIIYTHWQSQRACLILHDTRIIVDIYFDELTSYYIIV